ncbi:hypothetical protein ABE61_21760 [Lysinibacillus sphaericus]|uniref:hypothetical protein n=1 Tax=Lysinibacillus sphaericus TaxID=1421 RepID=UPI0018CD2B9E|nr:hypothetical protein [Lysinibacillus sphaericus]MBG9456566.1 hypothetical protein [Lysinibacillus sphaericus]MBG9479966.1 hypothetical protein [Lysinibacillus sphaericus]MBG9594714.1 hypothetical protein [Lysinibacillus sphaericus]
MESDLQVIRKESIPIIFTLILVIATFAVFFISRFVNEPYLTICLWLFALIDIGFIVSMVMGIRTKKTNIIILSVFVNSLCFVILTIFLLLVSFGIGFSEA